MGLDVTSREQVYRVIAEAASLGAWPTSERSGNGLQSENVVAGLEDP